MSLPSFDFFPSPRNILRRSLRQVGHHGALALHYKSQNVRIMIVWSAFIGIMILGGYAVYFQVLGVGTAYARSGTEAQLSLMLFVFGIYLLALIVHGYITGQNKLR